MINALFYEQASQWFLYGNALFYQLTTQWFLYGQCFVLSTNNAMISLWSMLCFMNQQHNGFFMINALFYEPAQVSL